MRTFLDKTGRGGPIFWPASLPDITPIDLFLWGYIKAMVYITPVNDIDHLNEEIREAVESL